MYIIIVIHFVFVACSAKCFFTWPYCTFDYNDCTAEWRILGYTRILSSGRAINLGGVVAGLPEIKRAVARDGVSYGRSPCSLRVYTMSTILTCLSGIHHVHQTHKMVVTWIARRRLCYHVGQFIVSMSQQLQIES